MRQRRDAVIVESAVVKKTIIGIKLKKNKKELFLTEFTSKLRFAAVFEETLIRNKLTPIKFFGNFSDIRSFGNSKRRKTKNFLRPNWK